MTNLFDLSGKVALVAGGNSGIGLGFATGIAKAGGDIVLRGRRSDKNEEAARALRSYGVRVVAQTVDVSDERQVAAAVPQAVSELGRLDCVIANAGISTRPGSFLETTTEQFGELLAISQQGAYFTLREGLRHMVDRAEKGDAGGSLIACGSLALFHGLPGQEHYAAAKGAVLGIIRGIAVGYGKYGIRANVVAPGSIETELGITTEEERAARFERGRERIMRTPIPRRGLPTDFEGIAVYLMSDASSFHTGDVIVIDGGYRIAR